MQIATDVGFAPPVLVKSSIITCEEPEMKKMAGRQSLLRLPLSLLCPLLFSSLFSFSISFFPYPSFSVLLLYLPFLFLLLLLLLFSPLLFLDLLFHHHHLPTLKFSHYNTPSTESAGGLQFCSATYRLMKVKWDKDTSAEDPLMEVKYKGQN